MKMARKLPPLNGLRAFEAAARNLSFTRAAEELHVTPAAVSQQVKSLESYFGVRLFKRLTRALSLTDAGKAVLPLLRDAFDQLAEADRVIRNRRDDRVLVVSVAPSFAAKWLVPRLSSFSKACPDYELRIDATDRLADFDRDGIDAALRYGLGDYPGLTVVCLLEELVEPVCSPALLEGKAPLRRPSDLRHHTLIHMQPHSDTDAAPNWAMWLKAAGVDDVDPHRGPRFSMESLAVQAAIEGQGVALVAGALVTDDIDKGRLVRPFPESAGSKTRFCYYLVYPSHDEASPKLVAFRDWVIQQAGRAC
jgi:LysR family glycine cleavage system transcriptional activator